MPRDKFICCICACTKPEAGFCSEHSDEPLLDVDDPSVLAYLVSLDEAALRKRLNKVIVPLGGVMFLMLLVSGFLLRQKEHLDDLLVTFLWIMTTSMVIAVLRKRLITTYQYRFGPWTNAHDNRPTKQDIDEAEALRRSDKDAKTKLEWD